MSQANQPEYNVTFSQDGIEIREYNPIIVAQVSMIGERKEAISAGFKLLADYIFGNNESRKKISMRAPVAQQEGERISMTVPVIQQESKESRRWHVRFVMPSEYTLETLPYPKNSQVRIISIPAKHYVVIRFSGLAREGVLQKQLEILRQYSALKKLNTIGNPIFAFYNPPWTLPFLRRNEIMFELG